MFEKRDDIAPYEIMRPGSREAREKSASDRRAPKGDDDAGQSPIHERPQGGSGGGGGKWSDWLTGGEPVVLRLPKGMAVLLGAGVLLLVVLAYWVGYARGAAVADARHQQKQSDIRIASRGRGIPTPIILEKPTDKAPGPSAKAGSPADPRLDGLNYLIIAHYSHDEAQRLRQFLSDRGVETFLTSSNNAGLFLVVSLKGFPASKAVREAYAKQLRQLGREWRAHNGNRGDDLGSMWWKKYQAPPGNPGNPGNPGSPGPGNP